VIVGDLICPSCKGRGVFVAFVDYGGKDRHKSGRVAIACPRCEGVGDVDPDNDARRFAERPEPCVPGSVGMRLGCSSGASGEKPKDFSS
jgi:hypothetical protein